MGHSRIGTLPATQRWEEVVELLAQGAEVPTVAARRQLNEPPDELWTKINIEFYSEPRDAFFKALAE